MNRFSAYAEGIPEGQFLDEKAIEKFKEEHKIYKARRIEQLGHKFPQYVDENGNFTGPIGVGAMEGLNSRLHYFLGVPYKVIPSIMGRTLAFLMLDAQYTFRRGKPSVSFAHAAGSFSWELVMDGPRSKKRTTFKEQWHWDSNQGHWYHG